MQGVLLGTMKCVWLCWWYGRMYMSVSMHLNVANTINGVRRSDVPHDRRLALVIWFATEETGQRVQMLLIREQRT